MVADIWSAPDVDAGRRGGAARAVCAFLLAALMLLATAPARPAEGQVLHVYDRLNRLRATVDPAANDAAILTYDGVGNIVAVLRQLATQTTILDLPADAVAGLCGVRILGIGFDPTPGQNTVTVNGVAATVQSSTATELVVCLGGSTTTGSVVVTTPTGSDTSDGPLPVQAAAAVLTVTGFTPGVAVWGTALTVTGTAFDPAPGLTRVRLGATRLLAPVSGVTATSLTATVPPGTTSGRLTLTTPAGTATAASDLFVPVSPYTASDVAVTGRLSLGGSQDLTIPPLKLALLVFDGTVGQKVCVGNVFTTGYSTIVKGLYLPTGSALFSRYSGGAPVIEVPPLSMAGTYQVELRNGSGSGTAVGTATLYDASDQVQGTIPANGTPTSVTVTIPCVRAGRTFAGISGQRISLWTSSTVNGSSAITIVNPDGTTLVTSGIGNGSSAFIVEPVTLPQTGTYTVWADPIGNSLGTLTHWLYTVVDGTVSTSLNAAPLSVTTAPTPGARVFIMVANGTAGQLATVRMTNNSIGPMTISLFRPDGSTQVSETLGGTSFNLAQQTLAVVGTYQVLVDPVGGYGWTGAVSVQVTSP